MRTVSALTAKAKELAQKYWGLDFNIPLLINRRLTRVLGTFKSRRGGIPVSLELSERLLIAYSDKVVEDVLKHELCHWALCTLGRPYKDHHPVFEKELVRIDAASTETITYVGELHKGVCSKCQRVIIERTSFGKLKRYIDTDRYNSKCCKASITYGGAYRKGNQQIEYKPQPQAPVAQAREPIASAAMKYTFGSEIEVLRTSHLLQAGSRGVTNKQMIPAMIEQIDKGSVENLKKLKLAYPEVFESSKKYLGKHQFQFQAMMTGA